MGTAQSTENDDFTSYDVLWEHTFKEDIKDIELLDGSLFVASDELYAFNVSSKHLMWNNQLNCSLLYAYENIIYSCENGNNETRINAIYAENGSSLWTEHYAGSECEKIVANEDILFFITFAGDKDVKTFYLFAINRYDGELIWEWKKSARVLSNLFVYSDNTFTIRSIEEDSFFVYSFDLNSSDSPLVRTFASPNYFRTESDNKSFYIIEERGISSVNHSTNSINWFLEIPKVIGIKIENDTIYAPAQNKLYSINSINGSFNWILPIHDTFKVYNSTNFRIEDQKTDIVQFNLDEKSIYVSTYQGLHKVNSLGENEWSEKLDKWCYFGLTANEVLFTEMIDYPSIYAGQKYINLRKSTNGESTKVIEIIGNGLLNSVHFSKSNDIVISYYKNKITAFSPLKEAATRNLYSAEEAINLTSSIANTKSPQQNLERAEKAFEQEDYTKSLHYSDLAKEQAGKSAFRYLDNLKFLTQNIFGQNVENEKLLEEAKIDYDNEEYASFKANSLAAKNSYTKMYDGVQLKNLSKQFILYVIISVFLFFIILMMLYVIFKEDSDSNFSFLKNSLFIKSIVIPGIALVFMAYSMFNWQYYSNLYSSLHISMNYSIGFLFLVIYLTLPFSFVMWQVAEEIPYSLVSIFLKVFSYFFLGIALVQLVIWNVYKLFLAGLIDFNSFYVYWASGVLIFINFIQYFLYLLLILILVGCLAIFFWFFAYRHIFLLEVSAFKAKRKGDLDSYVSDLNLTLSEINKIKFPDLLRFYVSRKEEIKKELLSAYYEIGDYDNCLKHLKGLKVYNKKNVQNIYKGIYDYNSLNENAEKYRDKINKSFFCKYLKLRSSIKKRYNIQIRYLEQSIILLLLVYYTFYLLILLSEPINGFHSTFSNNNLVLTTLFLAIFISALFVLAFFWLIFSVMTTEKERSLLFCLFDSPVSKITEKMQNLYLKNFNRIIICFVAICLLFAIQFISWSYSNWLASIDSPIVMFFLILYYGISMMSFFYIFAFTPFIFRYIAFIYNSIQNFFRPYSGNENIVIAVFLSSIFILLTKSFIFILVHIEGGIVDIHKLLLETFLVSVIFISIILYFRKILSVYFTMIAGNQFFIKKQFFDAYNHYSEIYTFVNSRLGKLIIPLSQEILTKYYLSFAKTNTETGRNKEAIKILNLALKKIQKQGLNSQLWQLYYEFGKIYESEKKFEKAYHNYYKSIKIIEEIRDQVQVSERKEQFFDDKVEVYSRMVLVCLKMDMDEKAFEFAEKAKSRVFLDMLASERIKIKSDSELQEKEKEILLKIKNIETKMKNIRGSTALADELEVLFEDYDKLLLQIKEKDPDYYALKKSQVLDIHDIQQYLGENEVLLEFFVGEECKGFLISPDSFDVVSFSVDINSLIEDIEIFRELIKLRGDLISVSKKLYFDLIKDLEPLLKGKELIIVPHGILHYLPFNALFDGNEWLIEKYDVRFLQSASMIQFLTGEHMTLNKALVVGDPTGNLDSAKIEAIRIAEKFNTSPLSGSDATKEAVLANIENKDILHFACHGIFEPDAPKFSRLALADGNLYVNDIYNLDINADLVTLSACQTALGSLTNGDEVEGMTRAFMRAGSPSVISSLWNVEDKSTEILFSNFYELEGNKAERLRKAQLRLMKEYGHPFYWAPFVLFGEK